VLRASTRATVRRLSRSSPADIRDSRRTSGSTSTSLDRLGRDTRVPVKTLGLAVVEQLV
jgi:hypothetical protein